MTRASDGTDVSVSPLFASSSNMGSPWWFSSWTWWETIPRHNYGKMNEIYLQLPLFMQNTSRIENFDQMFLKTRASQSTKIAGIEQIVGRFLVRVTTLETGAATGSSGRARRNDFFSAWARGNEFFSARARGNEFTSKKCPRSPLLQKKNLPTQEKKAPAPPPLPPPKKKSPKPFLSKSTLLWRVVRFCWVSCVFLLHPT